MKTFQPWLDDELDLIEREFQSGLTVQQVLDLMAERGGRLTEATFRKYVQLGLLPRSTRVGRKGKNRGSQGVYPPTTLRQLNHVRRLMSSGFTMEEIQKEFLFVRGDIDALRRQLERIYESLESALDDTGSQTRPGPPRIPLQKNTLEELRSAGAQLVGRLEAIEQRLSMSVRMSRAAV